MKTKDCKIYICEHCGKKYFSKYFAEKHEVACYQNPANFRECYKCQSFGTSFGEVESFYSKTGTKMVDAMFCKEKECFLLNPVSEMKGRKYEFENYTNEPMPIKCESFKLKTEDD